jgi:hypothetical protein
MFFLFHFDPKAFLPKIAIGLRAIKVNRESFTGAPRAKNVALVDPMQRT